MFAYRASMFWNGKRLNGILNYQET